MTQCRKQLTRLSYPAKIAGWAAPALLGLTGLLTASDLPPPVTLNLPIPVNQATPAWLGHPETPPSVFATLNLPILTPDPASSLLVTVYFQEKAGGFLRIIWKGTQGAQLLSDNFYEDIGMSNQRSLLIAPSMLEGDGVLTFQCGDTTLGITKIKLEWLQSKVGLVSPQVHDVTVTTSNGATQMSQDLNGQPATAQAGMWQDQVVSVPLTDTPVRIEQGVDFSVDLDKVPVSARLSVKEAGLPLGEHIVVWINGQRAGTITPSVPDLLDDGYISDDKASTSYSGWRDGAFYVPVWMLKDGVNSVSFSDEQDGATAAGTTPVSTSATVPLAVKNVNFQLSYQPAQPKTGLSQPQFWQAPSTPISPDAPATVDTTTTP